ncbi:MAG: P-loop containing nucleoside triphosphate hydrolase protein [Linnemannia gamsii]|nr:MAG: P-loop containing nucleoside triphosphate hydrolase protein [Linnemannia gamsii]
MLSTTLLSTRSRTSTGCCRALASPQQLINLRHLSTSKPSTARLPYFHKQLTKKDKLADAGATPNSLTPAITPPPPPRPSTVTSKSTPSSNSSDSAAAAQSKRQTFKSITPSAQLMHDIRIQGLGSKAETWSFDKSNRGNKTIRPWDKKLPEEEWKQLQKERRLPAKQVWFEQRTAKVIEKEQVRFPGMRFVAGAASMKSVPTEEQLLKLVRPDFFQDLAEIDQLLTEAEEGKSGAGSVDETATTPRLTMSKEEIQKLRERKRVKMHEIKDSTLPEIAIVGRSNVGKSTMLNTLTESPNTARVSSKPGLTRQLNFYRCGDKFAVVDMPGYGFAFAKEADKEAWKELIEDYLGTRKSLKRIYVMIDARHGLKVADKEFLTMMGSTSSKKFQVVLTKCDLISPPDLARTYMVVQEELKKSFKNAMTDRVLMVSSYTGAGMNTLRKDMLFACGQNILVRERERPKSTLR